MTLEEIKRHLNVPHRLLREIIKALKDCRIVSETNSIENIPAYQPAQDPDRLTVARILHSYENNGQQLDVSESNEYVKLADDTIQKMDELLDNSRVNSLLKEP